MQKLVQGIHHFQTTIFGPNHELFERLADQGQHPEALFITCSDSRVLPEALLNCGPGDLFVLRNAGNLVPTHGSASGGEAATIEYAVNGLGVRDIVVCGHSRCGAVRALLQPGDLNGLPRMAQWLTHAESTREIIRSKYGHLQGDALWTAAVEENVLVQIEHLRTHPTVAAALARGDVKLHAWVLKIETGRVFAYDPVRGEYLPLGEVTVPHDGDCCRALPFDAAARGFGPPLAAS
jgi:carbonic anhydrase